MYHNNNYNWKEHMLQKVKANGRKIKNLAIRKVIQSLTKNKVVVYKSFMKPILAYAVETWGYANNSSTVAIC